MIVCWRRKRNSDKLGAARGRPSNCTRIPEGKEEKREERKDTREERGRMKGKENASQRATANGEAGKRRVEKKKRELQRRCED